MCSCCEESPITDYLLGLDREIMEGFSLFSVCGLLQKRGTDGADTGKLRAMHAAQSTCKRTALVLVLQ